MLVTFQIRHIDKSAYEFFRQVKILFRQQLRSERSMLFSHQRGTYHISHNIWRNKQLAIYECLKKPSQFDLRSLNLKVALVCSALGFKVEFYVYRFDKILQSLFPNIQHLNLKTWRQKTWGTIKFRFLLLEE